MHTRHCKNCDEEFRPEIQRCSDCGGELEDRYEDEDAAPREKADAGDPGLPPPPDDDYLTVFACRDSESLKQAADCLAAAGVPFLASGSSIGFRLLVRKADEAVAGAALQGREGALAAVHDGQPSVGPEGGPCPACGASVPAGAIECPGCGLVVGAEDAEEDA